MTEQTMTARHLIQQEVYEAYQAGIDHESVPSKYPPMGRNEITDATDRIISIVREVLLSDEAVEANGDGWLEKSMEYWSSTGKYNASNKATEAFRSGLSAAIDAAFGKEARDAN